MELLASSTAEALEIFSNYDGISDKCFEGVIKNALSCVLETKRAKEILSDSTTSEVEPALLKQSYPALMTLFIESAKTDAGAEQLSMTLDECNFSEQRKETVLEVYMSNKQKLRANLALICQGPPHVVDVDWRLDYNLKNSQLNKVMDLQYTVALKTEQPSSLEKDSDVQFSCTREQLQDFVGKLKEAVKAVEKASQN